MHASKYCQRRSAERVGAFSPASFSIAEIWRYVAAGGAVEFVDRRGSGARTGRPALERLLIDARRHRFDVLVVGRLDHLERNLGHPTLSNLEEVILIRARTRSESFSCWTSPLRVVAQCLLKVSIPFLLA